MSINECSFRTYFRIADRLSRCASFPPSHLGIVQAGLPSALGLASVPGTWHPASEYVVGGAAGAGGVRGRDQHLQFHGRDQRHFGRLFAGHSDSAAAHERRHRSGWYH